MYRAAEHYRVLKDLNGGFDFRTYPVRMDRAATHAGLTYRFSSASCIRFTLIFPLILGDGFHNLRVLHHLVFQLDEETIANRANNPRMSPKLGVPHPV